MNKKFLAVFLFIGVLVVGFVIPTGQVLAQNDNSSIEVLQRQVNQLLEMIKSLQAQIDSLRGQTKPVPVPLPASQPERGWDTISGTLSSQGSEGAVSIYMWGTHKITEPTQLSYPTQGGKTYLVKAMNDEVLAMLKKYEGQSVTLWGQMQYQNLEGGFWGFVAKKVIVGTAECPLPAAGTKIGYSDDSVKVIQEVLKTDKSVYPEGLVTGYYGPLTARAVSRFQTKEGLTATGVLDSETKNRIESKLETKVDNATGAGTNIGAIEPAGPINPPTIRCPIPPKPIPVPVLDQGIKVYSPSSGEEWQAGKTYTIRWSQVWPTIISPQTSVGSGGGSVSMGVSNTTFSPIGPVQITLSRYIACLYEGPIRCMMAEPMPYVIVEKTDNNGSFDWTVSSDVITKMGSGKFVINVSVANGGFTLPNFAEQNLGGFSGRSGVFSISDSSATNNLPPVVSGVSGPTALKVGETGTWTIKAYDSENGSLSYLVLWGDEVPMALGGITAPKMMAAQNTATFTHVYNQAGNYTPVFYVTDDHNQTAKTSMSVVVGDSASAPITITSPVGGEVWQIGSTRNIAWQYSPELIQLIKDKGVKSVMIGLEAVTGINTGGMITRIDALYTPVGGDMPNWDTSNLLSKTSYSWNVGSISCYPGGGCQGPSGDPVVLPGYKYRIVISAGEAPTPGTYFAKSDYFLISN